ncbi:CatB-related O-acetyltransferase [Vibrio sp. S17_S38]|uniref:CatB-related O-acetyltransferase n=1 Tax=Vibrio sp. S17_S38 TaxID=2720229 RepID=UPI0016802952|nr:CatB-related O-acetyltransferase [Vibrio sp. S17_S38]MBD1573274.1 CatB-related O-acetyltransferase [Vibrio sp. S17_S38]
MIYKQSFLQKVIIDLFWKRLSKPKHLQSFIIRKISKIILKPNPDSFRYLAERYFNFTVGRHSYRFEQFFNNDSYLNLQKIGSFCSIGDNVTIVKGNHPLSFVSTHPFLYEKKYGGYIINDMDISHAVEAEKVSIENDVWIGANVSIMPGVTISNGAIIATGAVVTKDVPAYAIVGGIPAKIIRYRFESDVIEKLQRSQWWNWPQDKIKEHISLFYEPNKFIKEVNIHE